MKLTLTYGKPYVFASAPHDDDRTYVFVSGTESRAVFEEFRHNPADGSEEDLGRVTLDAYQISLLRQVRCYYLPVGELTDFFGSANPVCMDDQEASRLYDEFHGPQGADDADDVPFDEIFREASEDEIKRYGTYDSWLGTTTEPEREKHWYLIEDCTSSRSAVYDEILDTDTKEKALEIATAKWEALSDHDRRDRDEAYIGYAEEDEDGCVDYDTMTDIVYLKERR